MLVSATGKEIPVMESITEETFQGIDCLVCTFMDMTEHIEAKKKAFQASTEWRRQQRHNTPKADHSSRDFAI